MNNDELIIGKKYQIHSYKHNEKIQCKKMLLWTFA